MQDETVQELLDRREVFSTFGKKQGISATKGMRLSGSIFVLTGLWLLYTLIKGK